MNNPTQRNARARKQRTGALIAIAVLVLSPVIGWFVLNYDVVRGPTPRSAAIGGIAFLYPEVDLSHVTWIPDRAGRGPNFGREVHLTAYTSDRVVATATVTSFLGLGWQLQDYWFDGVETARVRGH